MMDWTDRYCRLFHRSLTNHALLYSEMITAQAVCYGDRARLLGLHQAEKPVALQLGGSDPKLLAEAAKWGEEFGYDEINLNVGCPSDRVQEGRFGACLMAEPELVGQCVAALQDAVKIKISVKCRLAIDDQDEEEDLDHFIDIVQKFGCSSFVVHARRAWLRGLSPKENRTVPPLNHERVFRLKQARPHLHLVLNGGISTLDEAQRHLALIDGVMMGRAAYHNPWLLHEVDQKLFGDLRPPLVNRSQAVLALIPMIEEQLERGVYLSHITRHMLGLYHGQAGGRHWRRILTENATKAGAGIHVLKQALAAVEEERFSGSCGVNRREPG